MGYVRDVRNKMVREITREGVVYFECEECRVLYKEKVWAMKCQKGVLKIKVAIQK